MKVKLTETVKKGGCAAKVPAMILREILAGVTFPPAIPGLSVDSSTFDDAAIYKITDDTSLVQTLDFFTPIVDSAYEFGAIASANALSDVYAMGGTPKTCMAILAAPLAVLEPSVIQEVLQGASDVIKKAGASLVGGHSIDDETLKFGLSVTGTVHPEKIWTNAGAKVGDVLILTKPLGTGTICAGIKQQKLTGDESLEAIMSMMKLNDIQSELSLEDLSHIHAATDITGFGLLGHSMQLAKASGVSLKISAEKLPSFKLAKSCLENGLLTKAHRSNREYTDSSVEFSSSVSETDRLLMYDPQTSGGLLLSVGVEASENLAQALKKNFPGTRIIGEVIKSDSKSIYVE